MSERRRRFRLDPELRARVEERLRRAGAADPAGGVPRRADRTRHPLSAAQHQLWIVDRVEGGGALYNVPRAFHLRGALDAAALARAVRALGERHEVLRSRVAQGPDGPFAAVAARSPLRLPVADLAGLPPARRRREARHLAAAEAARSFDLGRGPLARLLLVRSGGADHLLVPTFHHLVVDGRSLTILLDELGALYDAARGTGEAPPPPPVDYGDFAVWQRRRLEAGELDGELAWWREHLADPPPETRLPFDRPRPARPSRAGGLVDRRLPAALRHGVARLARTAGATPFAVVAAAVSELLSRYGNGDDLCLGTALGHRPRPELQGVVGYFVNPLAVRCRPADGETVVERVRSLRDAVGGAVDHGEVPFERLVRKLAPPRSGGRNPFFQVMLVYQSEPPPVPRLAGVEATAREVARTTAKFDLSFELWEEADGLRLRIEYPRERFDRTTAERAGRHLERLLATMAEAPAARMDGLPLLGRAERHALVAEWADRERPFPGGETLATLLAAIAREAPDRVALVDGHRHVSYRELRRRARALAAELGRRGVGPEVPVAVRLDRSMELVVAILAVVEAGGAYVPLDPAHPRRRQEQVLDDTGARVMVDGDGVTGAAEPRPGPGSAPAGAGPAGPETLAYVLYTSGSTGRPKGVAVSHRAVIRLVRENDFVRFGPDETFLLFAPAAFDASTLELWGPLLTGGRLEVHPAGPASLHEVTAFTGRRRVTTLWLTAALFGRLRDGDWQRLRGLRYLLAGGDVLPRGQVERALRRLPATVLVNGYGPTENTTFTCCHRMEGAGGLGRAGGPVPIGRPIANSRALVLDRRLRPVPVGVAGELHAGGPGLARGYLGRPAATAERFVPSPWGGGPGGRTYRTGDLVRRLPDGALDFLGRADDQVKVRGFRVEPGEVAAALAALPEVAEAAVVPRGEPGERRLVAYVVPRSPALTETGVLAALRETLPEAMVPARVALLPALPLNVHGKLDRGALPEPGGAAAPAEGAEPRGPVERAVAALWRDLLGLDAVGREEDFFTLGGHSLRAMELADRVRDAFRVELPLAALFERPTVAGIAGYLVAADGESPAGPPSESHPGAADPGVLSVGEEQLWFLHRMDPGGDEYHMPFLVRFPEAVEPAVLGRALRALAARHEALRTTYPEGCDPPGRPVRRIAPARDPLLLTADLRPLAVPAAVREAERQVGVAARAPFDLGAGPLARFVLVLLPDGGQTVLMVLHHAIADGRSVEVLLADLGRLVEALAAGRAPALPAAGAYRSFAARQRAWLASAEGARRIARRRAILEGAVTPLGLPTDRPRTPRGGASGGAVPVRLPAAAPARLEALAREAGATLPGAFLALFAALLGRLSGQERFGVGTPVRNRVHPDDRETVGLFANMAVVPADLGGAPTVRSLVARAGRALREALADQEVPFERLVQELDPERDPERNPLFQASLSFRDGDRPGGGPEARELPTRRVKFELTLELAAAGEGTAGRLWFRRDLFDTTTAARMARALERLAAAAAAGPDLPVAALDLAGPEERHQVLREWGSGPVLVPGEGDDLYARFRRQAERAPDRVALVHGPARRSYGWLDRRVRALAARLAAAGVAPEERVGILLERDPELVVAILAVLAAGGAYVPLDPAHPEARMRRILDDGGVGRVLTATALAGSVPPGPQALLVAGGGGPDAEADAGAGGIPAGPPAPSALAYVLFTSGSTGRPKGVAISHGNAVALLDWAREWGRRAGRPLAEEAVLAGTSASFDLSVFELFATLAEGGRVVLVRDALALPELPAAGEATVVNTVPSVMSALLSLGPLPDRVNTVMLAGEAFPADLARRIEDAGRVEYLYELYGPSEDTTYSTGMRVPWRGALNLGGPLDGARASVRGRDGRPVPLGAVGEVWLAGVGLARGYLGRPTLTAECFVPDPAGDEPGGRAYRSGDLARWLPSGEMEFRGRIDHQVKLRGFRVELGEVEAALSAHPDVSKAVAAVHADPGGARRLVAWAVPAAGRGRPAHAALLEHLRTRLPEYMVPAVVTFLDALPLTSNGKVDRKALTPPATGLGAAAGPLSGRLCGPGEELLAVLWADLLGVDGVGPEDDFFALGGHSLTATRVVARLRTAFGVDLPVRTVFEAPTIRRLAAAVETARRGAGPLDEPPLVPRERPDPLPLSFAQQRLWFLDCYEPGSSAYNLPAAMELSGRLDVARLAGALGEVVRRHEALRTSLPAVGGVPRQRVHEDVAPALPLLDLGALPEPLAEAEARSLSEREARRPFPGLDRPPLVRTSLIRLRPDRHRLVLVLHHAVSDGWSLKVLFSELGTLYARGREAALPPLPVQYPDFALWQREWMESGRAEEQLDHWRRSLRGLDPLELPTDRPRPAVRRPRGERVPFAPGPGAAAALDPLCRRLGATPFMVVLAGFQALLARLSGRDDVQVGVPVAGRNRAETEGLVGFFVNTLVVRTDLGGGPTFAALVERVREATLAAYEHQDVPFERVVEALAPERDTSRTPLFQVLFNFQVEVPRAELPGLEARRVPLDTGVAKFELELSLAAGEEGWSGALGYDATLFDRTTALRAAAALRQLLDAATADAGTPVADLPVLGLGERRQLLVERNGAARRDGEVKAEPAAAGSLEAPIAALWCELLGLPSVDRNANFFDVGGHSLLAVQLKVRLQEELGADLSVVDLFTWTTVASQARHLEGRAEPSQTAARPAGAAPPRETSIAVIGMSGRFPGARSLREYWRNLAAGVESIRSFSAEEDEAALVDPGLPGHPRYVSARGILDGVEDFDAEHFGFRPREAAVTDPQHRVFLECVWEALEDAGYAPDGCPGRVGLYAGAGRGDYFLHHLFRNPRVADLAGSLEMRVGNDKDFLPTRASYLLGLRGPSVAVQTSCSSSLVAVHMACRSLLDGECDLAIAGGVRITLPQRAGYLFEEGGVASPDGHCRAFDARARGMVPGNGAGVVVLKPLAAARADGDPIRAVIRGSAVNNDGWSKVGYAAPGVEGQAEVVATALAAAGVDPETVGYVEAHGTGTPVGDPIEVAALTRAFRQTTGRRGFCALGSVKPNVGHLDAAAGVAGLIKAVLALEHGTIPPTLHFERPNPELRLEESPFFVNAEPLPWAGGGGPRRAGVSSFGIGGTNAHVVLEEAPAPPATAPPREEQVLPLSARTGSALGVLSRALADHLEERPDLPLADVAYTLQTGRKRFGHRLAVVCRDREEAAAALRGARPPADRPRPAGAGPRRVAFLFPGQGSQHPGMAADLYRWEALFRDEIDRSCRLLEPVLGLDLRDLLGSAAPEDAAARLEGTGRAQPALFVVELALARLWSAWGVVPAAMLGHSIGEYVAATLAGVFEAEDALALVAERGRMMEELPPGAMLAVRLGEDEVLPYLGDDADLAAVNGPDRVTVSGPAEGVERVAERLGVAGVETRRLRVSHAFHSRMMDPIVEPFAERVAAVPRRPPSIPFVSNLTGRWIEAEQAADPAYWAEHLRRTVRFGDGLALLAGEGSDSPVLLEVGPGRTLGTLAGGRAVPSLPHPSSPEPAGRTVLAALARLWESGVEPDWGRLQGGPRPRVSLPTYPFERRRCWVEPVRWELPLAQAAGRPVDAGAGSGGEPPGRAALEAVPEERHGAPRNEAERTVAEVWREAFGLDRVGVEDDFFELGGDSLLATRIVSRLRDRLAVELTPVHLFEAPTVAGLAAVVEDLRPSLERLSELSEEELEAMLAESEEAE